MAFCDHNFFFSSEFGLILAFISPLRCCNTCEDVREAYRIMQWRFPDPDDIEQCKNDQSNLMAKGAFKEGCQIYGYLEVNRVSSANILNFQACKSCCHQLICNWYVM